MRMIFLLNIISFCVFVTLSLYTLVRRRPYNRLRSRPLDTTFIILNCVLAIGTFGNALFISSRDAHEAVVWFRYFSFTWYFSPGLFLLFCVLLVGKPFRLTQLLIFLPGTIILAAHIAIPQAILVCVEPISLGWHTEYNNGSPWHWFNVFNYTLCALSSFFILIKYGIASKDELLRRRAVTVLIAILITFFGTFFTGFLLRYFGHFMLPPMLPTFFSILLLGLSWVLFQYDLLALDNFGMAERILTGVYDAVVLVDRDGRVLETNVPHVTSPRKQAGADTGIPSLDYFIPDAVDSKAWLAEKVALGEDGFESQFTFEANRTSPASMIVRTISQGSNLYAGYIITAHNLSAEKELAIEVDRRMAVSAALRSVEANFSRAFRVSPAGMAIIEIASQIILDANDSIALLMKIPLHQIVGSRISELGISLARDEFDPIMSTLTQGEACSSRDLNLYREDGSRVLCIASASPLRFAGKNAALFIMVDVSELERLQNDLIRAQKLESIGVLAGGIAHDFNNIMTAILGNISLAKMGLDDDDPQAQSLIRAETACLRARELSRQLLTFSKGGEPKLESVDVVKLVREAVRMATAGSSTVSSFTVESGVPQGIVDSGQMIQCFNNLAINAVQAMQEGGTLFITIHKKEVAGWNPSLDTSAPADLIPGIYTVVEFKDSGPGIASELLDSIFDPYVSTKPDRSGLGLTICYSIMKRHRGGISVSSEEGRGAIFRVFIPTAAEVPKGEEPWPIRFGKGSVLIMDDEYAVRVVVAQMLNRLGYEPTVCGDGEAAVEAFKLARIQGRAFSAVILDLTVGAGMGGIPAAAAIRAMDSDVPLYVASGYSDAPVMADYASYGFDGVIEKPFGIEQLSRKLSGG